MTPRSFADRLGDAQVYRLTGLCDWLIAVALLSGIPRRSLPANRENTHAGIRPSQGLVALGSPRP